MKKILVILLWFCFPLLPLFFYLRSVGFSFNVYTLSVAFGVYSFTLLVGQLYIITKPKWLQKVLPVKQIVRLHSIVPLVVLVLSLTHRFLKESSGFSLETLQASIGLASWFFLVFIIIAALLLLANTFISANKAVKKIKDTIYSIFKLSYVKVRTIHNMTVLLSIALCVHVGLSSLTDISFNPIGTFILLAWVLWCFTAYIIYRIRGRK